MALLEQMQQKYRGMVNSMKPKVGPQSLVRPTQPTPQVPNYAKAQPTVAGIPTGGMPLMSKERPVAEIPSYAQKQTMGPGGIPLGAPKQSTPSRTVNLPPVKPTTGPNMSVEKPFTSAPTSVPTRPSPAYPAPKPVNVALEGRDEFRSSDPTVRAKILAMTGGAKAPANEPTVTETVKDTTVTEKGPPQGFDYSKYYKANDPYTSAREQYLKTLLPSDEEKKLADQLAQFRGDAQMGVESLSGLGTGAPRALVEGEQAKLQRQNAIGESTLLARLKNLQDARTAESAALKAEVDFAKADQDALKPVTIGDALVVFNPETGKYEEAYRAPGESGDGFTLSQGQSRFDAKGNLVAGVSAAPEKPQAEPATVQEYQFAKNQGYTGSFLDFQKAKATASSAEKPPTEAQSKAAAFSSRIKQAEGTISALEDQFTGLTSQLGFVPEYLKSENRKLMEQAQRNFINAVLRRESGAVISPDEFQNAMQQYFPQPGDGEEVLAQKRENRNIVAQSLEAEARGQLPGGDDIDQFLDSFSNDLGTSGNGLDAKRIAAAIKQVESGGNYQARGGSGETGAYQFMPSTWKMWAKQYLGNENAPQTPELQDLVAESRIADWLEQGYTPEQIALSWNAGSPVRRSGVNKYGVAYDSGAYADKVLKALG